MKRIMIIFSALLAVSGRSFFAHPLSLPQAQNTMLFKNLDLVIANQEYCKKDYELAEAKAQWYPSVDLDGGYGYQNKKSTITLPINSPFLPSGPLQMGTYDRSDLGLDISYPITAAFVNIYNVKYRTLAMQVKSAQNAALKNQLSFKLGALYFLWELSYGATEVQKTLVSQLEATVTQLKNLQAGGMASASRVLEAQARLANAKVQLCGNENQTDSLRLEVVNFIQCPDTAITPENYDINASMGPFSPIDTLTLNSYRPDLAALDLSIEQLSVFSDILSGQKYPNLVWTAGYHYGRPELNMGNNPKYMGYAMTALQFKFNLYDGDKVTSQQRQTQQQIEITQTQKQQIVSALNSAITSAKRDFYRAQRQEKAAQLSLEASHALAEDAKNSLAAGVVTSIDYLSALTEEAKARFAVQQAQLQEKMALLKVYFAAGKELKY